MPRTISSPVLLTLALLCGARPAAAAPPLVDCSKPEFQKPESAKGLWSWTFEAEKRIERAKQQGLFGVPAEQARGDAVSMEDCARWISYRGSAHCKEPGNPTYRDALARIQQLCRKEPPPAKGGPVDCNDARFTHPRAGVDQLLSWTDLALSSLEGLFEREKFRVQPICEGAHKNAATAYCKAPSDPRTLAALKKVAAACEKARGRFAAAEQQQQQATAAAIAKQKASRKQVPFPRASYRGGGAKALAAQMKSALLAGNVAKGPQEVLRVQPMGRWTSGRYTDTKVPYQKIMGTVLWYDKDGDGVCRFTSYKFIKDRVRGRWSPLRFKAFCNGCPEGWTACK